MIIYTSADSNKDLEGILALQQLNLPINLSSKEIASEGFLTVVHRLADLRSMNAVEKHIVAKEDDKVIAYVLAMTKASQNDIAVLKPMFQTFDSIYFDNRPVSSYNYIVVGQVCVDRKYRGQGVFDKCYETYKEKFQSTYDFAITEIATRNSRSINAHRRIGFKQLHRYVAPNGEEWSMVVWKW